VHEQRLTFVRYGLRDLMDARMTLGEYTWAQLTWQILLSVTAAGKGKKG
jgi:hypothetical protein